MLINQNYSQIGFNKIIIKTYQIGFNNTIIKITHSNISVSFNTNYTHKAIQSAM